MVTGVTNQQLSCYPLPQQNGFSIQTPYPQINDHGIALVEKNVLSFETKAWCDRSGKGCDGDVTVSSVPLSQQTTTIGQRTSNNALVLLE